MHTADRTMLRAALNAQGFHLRSQTPDSGEGDYEETWGRHDTADEVVIRWSVRQPMLGTVEEWVASLNDRVTACATLGDVRDLMEEGEGLGFHRVHVQSAVGKVLRARLSEANGKVT